MDTIIRGGTFWHLDGDGNCGALTRHNVPIEHTFQASYLAVLDHIAASPVGRCPECRWPTTPSWGSTAEGESRPWPG